MENAYREASWWEVMLNLWQCKFICKTSRANGV